MPGISQMRRLALRLLSFARRTRGDAELTRELRAHLRLLEDRFVAEGMSAGDARDAARRAFGGELEQVKARQRDVRSFRWLDESWLDLKLGTRMLVKYPGLTAIAVVALSVAIGGGAAYVEFLQDLVHPTLPGGGGERLVGIHHINVDTAVPEHRSLHDFRIWRHSLRSVELLGAHQPLNRNLITADGRSEPVAGVEISAAAFRAVPVSPLLGRPLVDEDERAGATPVAVIGHALWQSRFAGDPAIVGSTVRLGATPHTIVGVMPPGYGFPVNHSLWVPLRVDVFDGPLGEGPAIRIFGRLAPGASLEQAQAELNAMASVAPRGDVDAARHLHPQVKPYIEALWLGEPDGQTEMLILYSLNVFFLALLGICGANVATLVFARTATRETEITVRTALGASRGRIVLQLVAEALVLSGSAAAVGLVLAAIGLDWGTSWMMQQGLQPPFWWNPALSPMTVAYAAALALLAALMIGVVPAIKATSPQLQTRLKESGASTGGMSFGGVWTSVVVGQVALTIIFLLSVVSMIWNVYAGRNGLAEFAFPRQEFLAVRLEMDRDLTSAAGADAAFQARVAVTYQEIERQLERADGIGSVTYASRVPGAGQEEFFVELDSLPPLPGAADPLWVRSAAVAPDFFLTLNVPLVAGRTFTPAEAAFDRPVAIVDETFVRTILGGRDAIGVRVRQPQNSERAQAGPWYEIVGVVRDLTVKRDKLSEDAMLYRPTSPGTTSPLHMIVRTRGDANGYAHRVRAIAGSVGPAVRLYDVMRLDDVDRADRLGHAFLAQVLSVVAAVALLLSTAGVYSLMAFTVARRTREIGIRAAIGADQRQILSGVFGRALAQVGAGVVAGSVPGGLLVALGAPEVASGSGPLVAVIALGVVAAFMVVVALLACLVPARRALRVQPTDALRATV